MFLNKAIAVKAVLGFVAITSVLLAFQNCSNVKFKADLTGQNAMSNASIDWCSTHPSNAECIAPGAPSCTFNGVTYEEGQSVTAYLSSTGSTCTSEQRVCHNSTFSGSYSYASCTAGSIAASCLFNGQTIAHGASVKGFQNSSVAFGSTCVSENRTCNNGSLTGSYSFANCNVGGALSCLFNGETIAHGASVIGYISSAVGYGASCTPNTRTCFNGTLSGSGNFPSCTVGAAASCLFNGQSIASGASVPAFQNSSVASGQNCVSQNRTCTNGVLSGSYNFLSCNVAVAKDCNFNGQTIASGQVIKAYQNSTVPFPKTCVSENRACSDGNLSGSYAFASCAQGAAASCLFNGQTIAHGSSATAYQNSSVASGSSCVAESRVCNNGSLTGNYNFNSCTVSAPASCLFNGQTIVSGQIVPAYAASSVAYGQSCSQQNRLCTNGALSGSFTFSSCTVGAAASCLFNGQTIAHGQNVVAFGASTVAYGQSCSPQTRVCTNGTLSGANTFPSCNVANPASCTLDGQTIAHGQNVTAYSASIVDYGQTCASTVRTCNNGTLSGAAFSFKSCSVKAPNPCTFNGQSVPNATSVVAYATTSVAYGQQCASQNRVCSNGSLSGSYENGSCTVQPAPAGSYSISPSSTSFRVDQNFSLNVSSANASNIQMSCNGAGWNDITKNGVQSYGPSSFPVGTTTCQLRGINSYTGAVFAGNPTSITLSVSAVPQAPKYCAGGSDQVQSAANSVGQSQTCNFSWGQMNANTGVANIGSNNIGGGAIAQGCDANGNRIVQGRYCPAPAEPAYNSWCYAGMGTYWASINIRHEPGCGHTNGVFYPPGAVIPAFPFPGFYRCFSSSSPQDPSACR